MLNLLWRTCLVRVLAAVLLLLWPPSVSKIICISPAHEAIEDSAALCCERGGGPSGTALSEGEPCRGCTDYPVAPTAEIKSSQPDSSRVLNCHYAAAAVTVPGLPAQLAPVSFAPGVDLQFDPAGSRPQTTSLRC